MLNVRGYTDLLNDSSYKKPAHYADWCKVYYGISLHIDGACPAFDYKGNTVTPQGYFGYEYQVLFDSMLLNRHMREHETTRNFRLSQYKPFTKDPFQRVIHVINGGIFQDTGYSITIEDKEDHDFIWGNNFEGKTLTGFLAEKSKNIFEDPNGYFVVVPAEPSFATTTNRVVPTIKFAFSKNILVKTSEELVFKEDDYNAWVVNKIGYLRYKKNEQTGLWEHVDSEKGGYYAHLMYKLPIAIAGGLLNTQGYYDSWLDPAKAYADEYVTGKSSEQLVNKEASHPYIQVASEDCPDCPNGTVQWCGACNHNSEDCECAEPNPINYKLVYCKSCGGTGQKSRNPADWLVASKEDMDKDLIKIHNPDVQINEFHLKSNKEIFDGMIKALHLHWIEQSQSGVAKDRDMETRKQFISSISNDWFDRLIPFFIEMSLSLRNVVAQNGRTVPSAGKYHIVKPTQFSVKTAEEVLDEFKKALDSKAPFFVLTRLMMEYIDCAYGGDEVLKKKSKIVILMDKYSVAGIDYIGQSIMNGGGTPRQLQFHEELPLILDRIIMEKGRDYFINTDYETLKSEIDAIFEKISPITPLLIDTTKFNEPPTTD